MIKWKYQKIFLWLQHLHKERNVTSVVEMPTLVIIVLPEKLYAISVENHARACKSKSTSGSVAMVFNRSVMAKRSNIPQGLDQAATAVTIYGKCVNALVDSCSTESYISEKMAKELGQKIHPNSKVSK